MHPIRPAGRGGHLGRFQNGWIFTEDVANLADHVGAIIEMMLELSRRVC